LLLTMHLAFLIICIACAIVDYLTFKIPNKFVLVLLGMFAIRAFLMPLPELTDHLIIGGATLLVGFVAYAVKVIGAGDAKLLAVCMLWVSPAHISTLLLATAFSGAFIAFAYLCFDKQISQMRQSGVERILAYPWGQFFLKGKMTVPHLGKDRMGKGLIPYGVAISVGVLSTTIINKGNF
jgi:prepilin peptidase CpaA